jgi:hypothetical protein
MPEADSNVESTKRYNTGPSYFLLKAPFGELRWSERLKKFYEHGGEEWAPYKSLLTPRTWPRVPAAADGEVWYSGRWRHYG